MRSSKEIQNFIKAKENYKKFQYPCSAGCPTIGYGHKLKLGENYPSGINIEQAEELFKKDLYIVELQLQKALASILSFITQGMYDAIVSLVYNVGIGKFTIADAKTGKSTKCYAALLRADFKEAAIQMFSAEYGFVKADGKLSNGLLRRRTEERVFFGY